LGVDRKGVENYQILLGGSGAEDASLGEILGPGFDSEGIVDAVENVIATYEKLRQKGSASSTPIAGWGRLPSRIASMLVRGGHIPDTAFAEIADSDPLPAKGAVIVSLPRFLKDRQALLAREEGLGVRLETSESPKRSEAMFTISL